MNSKIDVDDQEENSNPYSRKKLQCHVSSSGVSHHCSPTNQAAELLKESYENLRRLRRLQRGLENQQESLISNYTDVRRTIVSMYQAQYLYEDSKLSNKNLLLKSNCGTF